jgi:hypothetical protein
MKMKSYKDSQMYYFWDSPQAGQSLDNLDIFEPHSIQYLFSFLPISIVILYVSNILFTF